MAEVARGKGALASVFAVCLAVWPVPAVAEDATGDGYRRPVLIRFEGTITPLLDQFVFRKLEAARDREADVVIIEIDSPGGFVESSFNIAHRLRDLDWARTVAFIPRQALSGAAIVALGCDEIVMAPDAVFGDAGPIIMGEDSLFRHAPEKMRSDVARRIRDLAETNQRPPALAEAMVDMELVVYRVQNRQTGDGGFMSDAEIEASDPPDQWEKGQPVLESRESYFLEVNGRRAVELELAERLAEDRAELAEVLGLQRRPVVLEPTGVDTAVFILNLPLVTGLLFVIGLVALYIEFSAPGISIGGLISLLCFALFFWSRFLGGTAEILEVVLFVTGAVFLAAEVFVIPGFGIAGISGVLLMLAGLVMASQDFFVPHTPRQLGTLSTSLLVVMCSAAAFLASAALISRHLGSIPILSRLALRPAADSGEAVAAISPDGKPRGVSPSDQLTSMEVGDWGVAATALRPAGKARFGDHLVDVITDGRFVERGQQVRIVKVQGNGITVSEVG